MVQEIHEFSNWNGNKTLRVTENYPNVENYWSQHTADKQGPLYVRITDELGERLGLELSFEEARRLVAGIESILAKVEAAEPKGPTRAERWAAAPIGAVVTIDGSPMKEGYPYRVKVGPDTWVSKYADSGVWIESDFHPTWDLAKEEK